MIGVVGQKTSRHPRSNTAFEGKSDDSLILGDFLKNGAKSFLGVNNPKLSI